MQNESQAEQALAELAAEQASANGNSVFAGGESGIKFSKDETGMKFGVRFTNKQLFVGVAALTAGVLLKHYGLRAIAAESASKVQDVAEQAEEAANRG
jgi:hypothetical protein